MVKTTKTFKKAPVNMILQGYSKDSAEHSLLLDGKLNVNMYTIFSTSPCHISYALYLERYLVEAYCSS